MMIWSFAFVGSASHWSAGPPAAAIWSYLSPGQMRPWCPGVTSARIRIDSLEASIEREHRWAHCSRKHRADEISPVSFHGKCQLLWTQKPTNAAMATRPCLISAWRRKPTVASLPAQYGFQTRSLSSCKNNESNNVPKLCSRRSGKERRALSHSESTSLRAPQTAGIQLP